MGQSLVCRLDFLRYIEYKFYSNNKFWNSICSNHVDFTFFLSATNCHSPLQGPSCVTLISSNHKKWKLFVYLELMRCCALIFATYHVHVDKVISILLLRIITRYEKDFETVKLSHNKLCCPDGVVFDGSRVFSKIKQKFQSCFFRSCKFADLEFLYGFMVESKISSTKSLPPIGNEPATLGLW